MSYSCFEHITINNYNAMFSYCKSNLHKFCIANNIKNLKELFEFVDDNGLNIRTKNSRYEITGLISILKFVYLGESLPFDSILDHKCQSPGTDDEEMIMKRYLQLKYNDAVRSLGLDKWTTNDVCELLEYGKSIGDAVIKLYEKWSDKIYITSSPQYITLFRRLEVLAKYYTAYKKNVGDNDALKKEIKSIIESYKVYKNNSDDIDTLQKEINDLINKRDAINYLIEQKSEILEKLKNKECKTYKKVNEDNIAK